jgi:integrase
MSIYRRKGTLNWWISISVAGRKTRRTTGTADRKQAQEYEERERARLWRVHKLGERGSIRFTEAAASWLDALQEKSRYKEESIVNWFEGEIKDEPINAITREVALELRQLLIEEGKSKSRTDRCMANLRAILNKAVEDGHLTAAPKIPMFNVKKKNIRWLTQAQFEALRTELPEHLALAAQFAVWTGLRMRAMLAITWDRVDLRRSRFWLPGEEMKGAEAHGHFIPRRLKALLRTLKTLSPAGANVFQYQGAPIDDCNTKAFKDAVKRAGVAPLRWHDLRHTFASWAVQNGVSLQQLMELGGWKSYSMVLVYAHLAPDHLAEAAELVTAGVRRGHSRHTASPRGTREKP